MPGLRWFTGPKLVWRMRPIKRSCFAQEHSYTICTQDLDFGLMLAASGNGKPSVVQIRSQDVLPHRIGMQVIAALLRMAAELEAGALVTVDPIRTRVRVLPFLPRL